MDVLKGGKLAEVIVVLKGSRLVVLVRDSVLVDNILDDDGIAAPGETIRDGDISINKHSPINTKTPITGYAANLPDSAYRPSIQTFKIDTDESAVVDRVVLSNKNGDMYIKFLIRFTHRPEIGDKFSSRHGQKVVCGTIVQQEDFPFSERGICPDLIMNPHGFPRYYGFLVLVSRMTVLQNDRASWRKSGGFLWYGISSMIYLHSCSQVFLATVGKTSFIQALDKIHARGNGPRVQLTRQPTQGKANKGVASLSSSLVLEDHNQELEELLASFPKEKAFAGSGITLYQDFWRPTMLLQNVISFQSHFQAHVQDIIVASKPKSGTIWLKAIIFSIVNRTQFSLSNTPLLTKISQELVPFFEIKVYENNEIPDLTSMSSLRLFSTHVPHTSLPKSIQGSKCRIVYVCRNPFDTLVFYWHFGSQSSDFQSSG
ncbi:hypothetical protein L6164_017793 [Bauhinia variegata]|uniref:Uncharacterized protein n=1 Tax=Bauhinia variegata TaxID=167791 RepID=A0ACB9N988_BAUVA|nr:hypothetical protein L6164_017793 [Bauhinia variegata]